MNYTLSQLKIFSAVVRTGSITRAAEELNLTQPAVSIQMKNFQDQFEIPLTETLGRKIYITGFGREIAATVQEIIDLTDSINYKAETYKGKLSGKLSVSIVSTGNYVMPYFLSGFMRQNPGVEVNMDVTNKKMVMQQLENNVVDFCMVSILPQAVAVNKIELLENKLILAASGQTKTEAEDFSLQGLFKTMPFIFRESGSGTRQAMEKFFKKNKIQIYKKMELTFNDAVKQAVIAGLGVSIMPMIGIINEIMEGKIKIINAKGLPIKTTWQLIWKKGKRLSPIADAFVKYIQKEKQDIVHKHFPELPGF